MLICILSIPLLDNIRVQEYELLLQQLLFTKFWMSRTLLLQFS